MQRKRSDEKSGVAASATLEGPKRLIPRSSLHRAVRTPRTIGSTRGIVDSSSWSHGRAAAVDGSDENKNKNKNKNKNDQTGSGGNYHNSNSNDDDGIDDPLFRRPVQTRFKESSKLNGPEAKRAETVPSDETQGTNEETRKGQEGPKPIPFANPRGRQHVGTHHAAPSGGGGKRRTGVHSGADERFLRQMETSYGFRQLMGITARASGLADLARRKVAETDPRHPSRFTTSGRRNVKNFAEDLSSIRLFKEIFDEYDRDGSGSLSKAELHEALLERSPHVASRFFDMFEALDRDASGQVNFAELLQELYPSATRAQIVRMAQSVGLFRFGRPAAQQPRGLTEEERNEMQAIFRLYDVDGSGLIDAAELRAAFQGLSSQEIDELIAKADVNGDGCLDFNEFVQLMA